MTGQRFVAWAMGLGAALLLSTQAVALADSKEISGAGATFPYPIYAQWANTYNKTTGVKLNYQSIGSGGGIAQIKAKTVDFGASDAPLKPEDLAAADLIQWPMVVGGAVPVVNLPGIKANQLKMSSAVLSDIYLGKIVSWDDAAIAAINPGLTIPKVPLSVVRRSDGSGTTFIWTNYLSKVSKEWADKVGFGTSVSWPVGLGGKGNEGVSNYVKQIEGSIGYVELAYAQQNNLSTVVVENAAGKYVTASIESFASAAGYADWSKAPGNYLILTNQPGAETWPISGATFILFHKMQEKPETATEVLKFFAWCYANGSDQAKALLYVPIPPKVTKSMEAMWKSEVKTAAGAPIWQ
jgi:phosphate transport system substrate-binding protein